MDGSVQHVLQQLPVCSSTPHALPSCLARKEKEWNAPPQFNPGPHLCCNAHWACIGVALAHHDTAQRDEGSCRKPKLLCAQQRSDCDVTPRAHLPICLQRCAAPQVVRHEGLVGLCKAQLPGQACVLDGRPLGGTWVQFCTQSDRFAIANATSVRSRLNQLHIY
jgi:hypothetical protein